MAQHLAGHVDDLLGQHVVPAPQEGEGPGGGHQTEAGPGTGAVGDVGHEVGHSRPGRVPGGEHEPHHEVEDPIVQEHGIGGVLEAAELVGPEDRLGVRRVHPHPADDLRLFQRGRETDQHLHEETVPLRLGQRVDAFALDGVLGGEHQERVGHRISDAADGNVAFGHGLQQGGLHLGRRPVDLVGQDQVGEDRPELDVEPLGGRSVHPGADQVGGDQIRGELQADEAAAHHPGQGLGGQRLGQARGPFQQAVAPGQQAHHQPLDHAVLADDDALHLEERPFQQIGVRHPIHH